MAPMLQRMILTTVKTNKHSVMNQETQMSVWNNEHTKMNEKQFKHLMRKPIRKRNNSCMAPIHLICTSCTLHIIYHFSCI